MKPEPALDTVLDAFSFRNIPVDLKAIYIWIACTAAFIYVPVLNGSPLRVVFALPMVLFVPGYALIAALFPSGHDIDWIERIALSFGLSIAVVPLIGLVLNYTPWGIRLDPIVVSLVIFTVAMALIAQWRRFILPGEDRLQVPVREVVSGIREELFAEESSRLDRALSMILVIAIAAAIITTVYVIVVPKEGEKFTEFYILGSKGKAADYPTDLFAGTPEKIIIGVGNHEYRNVNYTVEMHLVNQTFDPATNSSTIHAMTLLDRFPVTLPHNTTFQETRIFSVNDTEYNQLKFLLFNETVPSSEVTGKERINASYRDLHLWITVRPQRIG